MFATCKSGVKNNKILPWLNWHLELAIDNHTQKKINTYNYFLIIKFEKRNNNPFHHFSVKKNSFDFEIQSNAQIWD